MVKTLYALFTNGRLMRLVKFENNGATGVIINDRTSKYIASKADTNFGLTEVKGFILVDSWFE